MKITLLNIRLFSLLVGGFLFAACASQGIAHNIKGLDYPTLATARITSPTASTDFPVPIYNTGVSVACFNVRNTSSYDAVITAVGLDLPGDYGTFHLVLPDESDFYLASGVDMEPLINDRILDLAFLTGPRFNSDGGKRGLHPSAEFTTMCASGPYPAGMNIETILNYVFVRFTQVGPNGDLRDVGIWENAPRPSLEKDGVE